MRPYDHPISPELRGRADGGDRWRRHPALLRCSGKTGWQGKLAAPLSALKAGRNDPCPCGSGKKFKALLRSTDFSLKRDGHAIVCCFQ